MKNLNGYWVNKNSGTIHHVLQDTDWNGNIKLFLIVVIFHMKEVIISEILIRVSKVGTILSKGS